MRRRSRKFPALVNCTAINFFYEWPKTALESVAKKFLLNVDVLPVSAMHTIFFEFVLMDFVQQSQADLTDSVAVFMAYVLESVNDISKTYLANEKRFNYTTPKSYLELISLYSKLLTEKTDENIKRIQRLENGLIRLAHCGHQVDSLKVISISRK